MVYSEDVTGYQVGDKVFEKGAVIVDDRGMTFIDQSYHLAYNESKATGLPIVTLGEDQRDKVARLAAEAEARKAAKAL